MASIREDDFVLTLSDDFSGEDSPPPADSSLKRKREDDTAKEASNKKSKSKSKGKTSDDGDMDSDFEFQVGDAVLGPLEDFDGWGADGAIEEPGSGGNKKGVDIDELIARRPGCAAAQRDSPGDSNKWDGILDDEEDESEEEDKEADQELEEDELLAPDGFGMGVNEEEDESDVADNMDDEEPDEVTSEDESASTPVALNRDSDRESDDEEEKARQEAFFAPETKQDKSIPQLQSKTGSFQSMNLSRPILRGLASVGFSGPTPIQEKTIPVALLGKDIVGGAVTGSGKTGAFMIPILERLLYRQKKVPTSRVAILMPTRELAVQCFNVAKKLASFTDITFCQLVGGFSLREQESVLKKRPDVIIATPGRFIDHMRNSAAFTIDTLEILVLDEADRMLDDGFADELNEILTTIPKSRQTMLFSATMTSSVDKLIHVGLNRPVRLLVDAKRQTVTTLTQEFVRLRPGREEKRLAYLIHLCKEVFTDRCIIFFRQKKEAHRVRIIFALLGFKVAELHGSMSQEQRIAAVESFRSGTRTHLLATDVASRGLDIKNVSTVINYSAPQSLEIYLHRVGRTARAGAVGRSCTLASETDRKVVKAAVKTAKSQGTKIVSRTVDAAIVDGWDEKLKALEDEVGAVLKEEAQEKAFASAEKQVKKGENLIEHREEIMSRPKRTWFESEKDKRMAKKAGREELNGATAPKEKKGKLSNKDKRKLEATRMRKEGAVSRGKTKVEREGPGLKAGSRKSGNGAGKKNKVRRK